MQAVEWEGGFERLGDYVLISRDETGMCERGGGFAADHGSELEASGPRINERALG